MPMSVFEAIILGLVEGITEFLPISSTAHLMLAARILNLNQSEFVKSFEIVIQLGAIFAVLSVFGELLLKNRSLWKKIVIAFIPTATIGFLLYKTIKTVLIGNLAVAAWSLIIGGAVLIIIDRYYSKREAKEANGQVRLSVDIHNMSNTQAFIIGTVQSLAVIPGVSRSAATFVPALLFGFSRKAAAEFSFLLAIPTIAAAAGYDTLKNFHSLNGNIALLIIGFAVSFLAALVSIKFLLSFIQRNSFVAFGIYRIIIGALFLLFFI